MKKCNCSCNDYPNYPSFCPSHVPTCGDGNCNLEYFYGLLCEIFRLSTEAGLHNNEPDGKIPGYFQEAIDLLEKAIKAQKLGIKTRDEAVVLAGKAFEWYNCNIGCPECERLEKEIKVVLQDMYVKELTGLDLMMLGLQKLKEARDIKTNIYAPLESHYFDCVNFDPNTYPNTGMCNVYSRPCTSNCTHHCKY